MALDVATFLSEPSLPISQLLLRVRFGLQNALEFVHLVSAFLVHKKRGKKIQKKLNNTSEDDVLLRLKAPSYFHVCFPGKAAIFLFFSVFFSFLCVCGKYESAFSHFVWAIRCRPQFDLYA